MTKYSLRIVASALLLVGIAAPAFSQSSCGMPPPCAPEPKFVTKMVPCVKTETVAEVVPCWTTVPVTRVGYKCQKVLVKGTPVGPACGQDPCTQCCPQPFSQVVDQMVPFTYCDYQKVPYYQVQYKKVCRPVWLPQTYRLDLCPLPSCQ
ncbi:MAG: hypothetical protein AB1646_18985 [Thermodesulfobacteriota bacterium]